jgi:hypothetical protein
MPEPAPHQSRAELHKPRDPWTVGLYGLETTLLRESVPPIAPQIRYGLIEQIGCTRRTRAYAGLQDLARAVHRRRGEAALFLEDQRLVCGHCEAKVVAVYTMDESGYRSGFLGFAYLEGAGWRTLQAELYALQPNRTPHAEALHG